MENKIQGQKSWSSFHAEDKVGVIATLFTEEFLRESYEIHPIKFENFKDDIELNGIETIFIDNDLFESDHIWYKKNRGELINYLKNNNKKIVVVQNTMRKIANIFKQAYVLEFNLKNRGYNDFDIIIQSPVLVNETIHNTINSAKKKVDIVYLNIASGNVNKTHNLNFSISKSTVSKINVSRELLNNLIVKIKSAKILYISNSKVLDQVTIKYLEIIANLNSTFVVFDYKWLLDSDYFEVHNQSASDNIIYALLSNPEYLQRKNISKQREKLLGHTMIFNQDLKSFLDKKTNEKSKAEISVITATNRKENLYSYLERMKSQERVVLDIVVVTHGFEVSREEIKKIKKDFDGEIQFICKDASNSLGNCLNTAIDLVKYPVIAKIDDDDYYYKNYLIDQWLALQYSDADIVGKSSSFYYFERDALFVMRRVGHHSRYCDHIMGATIMSPASIMKDFLFSDLPRAVDSDYIRRVLEENGTIYATHPYEMCVFRAQDLTKHTWSIDDMSLYRHAKVMGYGNPELFVEIN